MTFIAILLVLTLIGFFVAIGFIIAVALNFKKVPARIKSSTATTKDYAVEVFNTGKGIAATGKIRADGYIKHGTRIVNSVRETADDVGTAARSAHVTEAASTVKKVAEAIFAAQEGLAAAKGLLDILAKSRKDR